SPPSLRMTALILVAVRFAKGMTVKDPHAKDEQTWGPDNCFLRQQFCCWRHPTVLLLDPGGSMRLSRILACFVVSMLLAAASAAQLRQVAIVEIPGRPGFDAVAFSGKFLLIAHTAANTLDVFDPARRRVVAQVKDLN